MGEQDGATTVVGLLWPLADQHVNLALNLLVFVRGPVFFVLAARS